MSLTLNMSEVEKIEAVANIFWKLNRNKGIVCTLACKEEKYYFRVFRTSSAENILWACEKCAKYAGPTGICCDHKDDAVSWAERSNFSYATSMPDEQAELLVEICGGSSKKYLLELCENFTRGLQRKEKGSVAYWE